MAANPAAGARFDASMGAVSTYALEAGSAAELFDWSEKYRRITSLNPSSARWLNAQRYLCAYIFAV
jgi:hypothetical protein